MILSENIKREKNTHKKHKKEEKPTKKIEKFNLKNKILREKKKLTKLFN
jgi:hypothetical protein